MIFKVTIFSRDRAMQLDATLHSFFLHCSDCDKTQVFVLYKTTNKRHENQYNSLMSAYPETRFIRQKNFRQDLLSIISPDFKRSFNKYIYAILGNLGGIKFFSTGLLARLWEFTIVKLKVILFHLFMPIPSHPKTYLLFLVDDNLFTRDFSTAHISESLHTHSDALGFSLRLGKNTTHCYTKKQIQSLPKFMPFSNSIQKFIWTDASYDFNYPLEISSSVYRAKDIIPLIASLHFENPNELEGAMATSSHFFSKKTPALLCFEKSATFCNPINMVQSTAFNRVGVDHRYTVDELADKFASGFRINVASYRGMLSNACHQETELNFTEERCLFL